MINIRYQDITVGAREKFSVKTDNSLENVSHEKQILQNLIIKNYQNPIEEYAVILDGESLPIEADMTNERSGFWSEEISDKEEKFQTPIVLELTADESFATNGINLEFDRYNNIFATLLNIKAYLGETLQIDSDFEPNNYAYFCDFGEDVEYDKIILTVYSLNVPKNRLKIQSLQFGKGILFLPNEIKSVSVSHNIDISSLTLPIGTANIRLHTERADDLNFEEQQPLIIDSNNGIESKTYIKNAKRINKTDFVITAEDEISILDGVDFVGGVYFNRNAYSLYKDIFMASNSLYFIDESFKDITISGYIPYTTCRIALQQLAFATNGVIITAYGEGFKVIPYSQIIEKSPKIISLRRLKSQNIDTQTKVGNISITSHSYLADINIGPVIVFEDDGSLAEETELFLKLTEPHFEYSIENGELLSTGASFLRFKAKSGCKVFAKKYKHTTKQKSIILNEKNKNSKSISNATLVGENNIDTVIEKCYNYYSKNKVGKMSIIDVQPIKVGEVLKAKTLYAEGIEGIVTSQSYSLVGNTFVKDTEIIGIGAKIEPIKYGEGNIYGEFIYGTLK